MKNFYQWLLVIILSFTVGVVFFERNALNMLMPFIAPELKLDNTMIGALLSALSLTWALSGIVIGRISDSLGNRKWILIICVIVFSAATFVSGIAHTFMALMGARLLMGFAEGGVPPISQALISGQVEEKNRGLAMGVTQLFGTAVLGNFVAPLLLVGFATAFGWRSTFFFAAVPGLLMAALVLLFVKDTSNANASTSETQKTSIGDMLAEFKNNTNVPVALITTATMLGFYVLLLGFMPVVLTQSKGVDPKVMGQLMSMFGIGSTIASFLLPGASDKFGRKPALLVGLVLGLLFPIGALILHEVNITTYIMFLVGSLVAGAFPIIMSTIPAESVKPANMAGILGLIMGVGEIAGGVITPTVAGALADKNGQDAILWTMIILLLVSFVFALFIKETAPSQRKHSEIEIEQF